MKKLISLLMAVVMLFGIGAETFAAYEGDKLRTYESADCTITYNIANEWSGNQQVSVSITNNSEETLRNWAIKLDGTGTVTNIWNASVLKNDGELCVIRNNSFNYEIIPGTTVEFGFMQQGEDLRLPENISICSRTADSTESAEISYEIQNNWGEGFIAAVTIKNVSDEPLEAWKLHFNGNFEIVTLWNGNLLHTDDSSFKVENDITTTPIDIGGTKTFSFEGRISAGEEPGMSDFVLTSIVIDVDEEQPDETVETTDTKEPETVEVSTTETGEPSETEETTETSETTETEEPIILCFGEYLAEENAVEVYWYSNAEGAVSVYESADNGGWIKLAEVADEDSYKIEITEDFLVKQIKVKQETESGTIESDPFVVAYTEDGYICTWLDTDADGLPDYLEEIYSTDPENSDTDNDNLSDYDELYTVGTSPLKYDTDEDGMNDADSDLDKDGLTNAQELELGTSPSSEDTDGDTLSDYAELYETNTDPLKADTDDDTLSDSEDITLGFDPNNPETFGMPDAEYKVEQTISADSEVMERVNTDEAPYELSLEITASGNAATNLIAGSSVYSTITESSARLGGAVSLSYYGGEVEKVKLIYEVGEDYISNDGSEYAANCVDLQGIKRYNIFRYFEDVNMLLPVATEFDEENNTLYAITDELGTYCVLDMEILLQNLGIASDEVLTETVMQEFNSAAPASDTAVATGYHVAFIVDERDVLITEDDLAAIKTQILEFAETVVTEKREIIISIYRQDNSDFKSDCSKYIGSFESYVSIDDLSEMLERLTVDDTEISEDQLSNTCVVSDGLSNAINNFSSDTQNYIFDIYSQTDAVYDSQFELKSDVKVDISIISDIAALTGEQAEWIESTGGLYLNCYTDFAESVYEHIFEENYEDKDLPEYEYQAEFPAILASGYQSIILDSELYPNGMNPSGEDTDTDIDGLTDWDEVNFAYWEELGLVTRDEKNNVILPTIQECIDRTDKFYVQTGLDRFKESIINGSSSGMTSSDIEQSIIVKLSETRVMPISSDPTSGDSDGDYVTDFAEKRQTTNPLKSDTDGDGLDDGNEDKCGTSPFSKDTDYDGLNDKYEVDNELNPLVSDTDGDGISDSRDPNPSTYDVDWTGLLVELAMSEIEFTAYFLDGAIRGDFILEPNFPQLLGVIAGSFIPLIDIRDIIANIVNVNQLGIILSAVGLYPAYGDAVKMASKIVDFITTTAKNADEVALLIKCTNDFAPLVIDVFKYVDDYDFLLKRVPCKQAVELFAGEPAIQKFLNIAADTADETADQVVTAFKRINGKDTLNFFEKYVLNHNYSSVSNYTENYSKLLDKVSGFEDELIALMGKIDDVRAVKVLELSAEYGSDVLKAIDKCGAENIDNIVRLITESGTTTEVAKKFLGLLSSYGESALKAVDKCGAKTIQIITYTALDAKMTNASLFLELVSKYGYDVVNAVKRCHIDNVGIIFDGFKLCSSNSDTATKLFKTLANHSQTMIKALGKCQNIDTIQDYLKIFDLFGKQADNLFKNGDRVFSGFIGLDKALESGTEAICFVSAKSDDVCLVTVNRVYEFNNTITVPEGFFDNMAVELTKIPEGPNQLGIYYTQKYNYLLSQDYIKDTKMLSIEPDKAVEYQKLINAISSARLKACDEGFLVDNVTGNLGEYSLVDGRSIINCSEIWAAREMISLGYKFDELIFSTRYHIKGENAVGALFKPCPNCCETFKEIIKNLEGYNTSLT